VTRAQVDAFYLQPRPQVSGGNVCLFLNSGELSVRNPSVDSGGNENSGCKYHHCDRESILKQRALGWAVLGLGYVCSLAIVTVCNSFCVAGDWRGVLFRLIAVAGLI
jgi:hypothetical protein